MFDANGKRQDAAEFTEDFEDQAEAEQLAADDLDDRFSDDDEMMPKEKDKEVELPMMAGDIKQAKADFEDDQFNQEYPDDFDKQSDRMTEMHSLKSSKSRAKKPKIDDDMLSSKSKNSLKIKFRPKIGLKGSEK